MRKLAGIVLIAMLLAGVAGGAEPGPSAEDLAFFERSVRPVLVEHCHECHSAEAEKLKGGLFVDSRAGLVEGGDSGPAIVPGEAEKSLLIEAIRYGNVDLQMPPKTRLPEEAVAHLEKWVVLGAPWPEEEEVAGKKRGKGFDLAKRRAEHWCWSEPRPVTPPDVRDVDWPLQPLDRFVLAKLEEHGLRPALDADRATWLRRVSFDLCGLPPSRAEVEDFLADDSPEAHARVVDRLLDAPEFGETWARHWLDLVRYAESYGHEFDFDIPAAWRYRDYVVRAFAQDVPHDQMVREAIAGDLLTEPRRNAEDGTNESLLGTGFWFLGEASHAPTDVRGDEATRIDNQLDVLTKSFLGLTVACARCHDHKFDAISTTDYYALSGFLQSSRRHLAMQDPGGEISRRAEELRALQEEASSLVAEQGESPGGKLGEEVLAGFDHGLPRGWSRTGEAFPAVPSGFTRPAVALLEGGKDCVPGGVLHSGLYGRKLHGALRSPTFTLVKPEIHVRLAAEGPVRARVVIDGYFMGDFNGLLFSGTSLQDKAIQTGGQYEWKTFGGDLRKYVGHRVYLEFLDEGDGYLSLDEVAYRQDKRELPAPVPVPVEAMALVQRALALEQDLPAPRSVLAMTDGTAENDRVHIRGGHRNLGDEVPRRFLTALGGEEQGAPARGSGRLELAEQMASASNPLTARVQVNRIWHHLTGRGLVPTVDDFGVMGEAPSHPDLLDWLAREFVAQGWSNKRMIRSIVLSRTYRMSCQAHPENATPLLAEADPSNILLHKFRVRRLSSEAIRDAILAVSGRLDRTLGGPSVPVHLTSFMEGRGAPTSGPLDGAGRRSLYTSVRRNFLPPFQLAFDMPIPFSTMGRRSQSNVPAQSLVLMNDPFVVEQAALWAKRLLAEPDREARIRTAWLEAFAREPDSAELAMALEFLDGQSGLDGADPDDERRWSDFCHLLYNKKEFIFLR